MQKCLSSLIVTIKLGSFLLVPLHSARGESAAEDKLTLGQITLNLLNLFNDMCIDEAGSVRNAIVRNEATQLQINCPEAALQLEKLLDALDENPALEQSTCLTDIDAVLDTGELVKTFRVAEILENSCAPSQNVKFASLECATELACNLSRSANLPLSIVEHILASPSSGEFKSSDNCLGSTAQPSCLTELIHGVLKDLWHFSKLWPWKSLRQLLKVLKIVLAAKSGAGSPTNLNVWNQWKPGIARPATRESMLCVES